MHACVCTYSMLNSVLNIHSALAEAGIVRSKLSNGNSGSNPNHAEEEHGHFSPER